MPDDQKLLEATKRLCAEMIKAGLESHIDPKVWDAVQDAIAAAENPSAITQ